MRIALAQINTTVGDLQGNARKITEHIIRAREMSVNVIAFPELVVTGYPPEDLLLKKHFVEDNLKVLKSLSKETKNITAVIGFVDVDKKGQLFNAAAVIQNKRLKGVYHKERLPNYGVFDEKRYFMSGRNNKIFKWGPAALGVSICEDIWTQNGPCRKQAKAGAKVLINISSSPYYTAKGKERENLIIRQARQNKVYVCYANLVGGQDELVFDGASMVVDPQGKIVAAGKQFEEDLVVADLDVGKRSSRLPINGSIAKRLDPVEEVYRALVLGTRDYIQKNGFKKAVIGLSGGIDSSLTALIACDAIGKENVVGISMPSRFTSEGTRSDARVLAQNLGITFKEIPIGTVWQAYLETLKGEFAGCKSDITEENLQARVRGNILMAFSNKFGWLVLTTGNKSEIAVGYCTLYGDMAGGFAVIKDVPKTKIYELARFRNEFGLSVRAIPARLPARQELPVRSPLIPESVFTRPPTAELRENQKDVDSLPPYEILDPILERYVEFDKDIPETAREVSKDSNSKGKVDINLIRTVANMVDRTEYKRRQAPPGVKITPKAFGRDRRLPITNRYREY